MSKVNGPQALADERDDRGRPLYREVYFVQSERLGMVKIGSATDSQKRLSDLQVGSPDKLILRGVLVCDDAPALEQQLHQRFAHLRRHGEWFEPDEQLLAYMVECLFERSDRIKQRKVVWSIRPRPEDEEREEPAFTFRTKAGESPRAMSRRLRHEADMAGVEMT